VLLDKHQRIVRRQLIENAYALGTQIVCSDYIGAVRTGANSWWDYRTAAWNRDFELWQVDKARLVALVDKSTHFLDTFWKLARKRSIPDQWLVRNQDLDALEEALREPDLEVRLRILKRMERFMEAFPPYWYYVGRTQQALGQLFAAVQTYEKLEALGVGHFRRDQMLAAAAANRAVIQDYLRQREAEETARAALRYSTDVWEVNLLCARVLARFDRYAEAEDAVLRNLDSNLEREQSLGVLLSIYHRAKDIARLSRLLSDPGVVRAVPTPLLLQCAALFSADKLPQPVLDHLRSSLHGYFEVRFGTDDLVLLADDGWRVQHAELLVNVDGRTFNRCDRQAQGGRSEARFRQIMELGNPLGFSGEFAPVSVMLQYPNTPAIRLYLQQAPGEVYSLADTLPISWETSDARKPARRGLLRIVAVDVGTARIRLAPGTVEELIGPAEGSEPADSTNGQSLPSLLGVIQDAEPETDTGPALEPPVEVPSQAPLPPGPGRSNSLPVPPAPAQ
jgi:hypothetical protein